MNYLPCLENITSINDGHNIIMEQNTEINYRDIYSHCLIAGGIPLREVQVEFLRGRCRWNSLEGDALESIT